MRPRRESTRGSGTRFTRGPRSGGRAWAIVAGATKKAAEAAFPVWASGRLLGARTSRGNGSGRRGRLAGVALLELVGRILLAVLPLDRLAGGNGGASDEAEVAARVEEHDLAVVGVDAFFHG